MKTNYYLDNLDDAKRFEKFLVESLSTDTNTEVVDNCKRGILIFLIYNYYNIYNEFITYVALYLSNY